MSRQRVLHEQTVQKSTKGGDARAGSYHDHVLCRVLGQEHCFSNGTSDADLVSGFDVAQEVGANALLRGILLSGDWIDVLGATDAQADGAAVEQIAVSGGCDGVQSRLVLAAVLWIRTRRDDAKRLTFKE